MPSGFAVDGFLGLCRSVWDNFECRSRGGSWRSEGALDGASVLCAVTDVGTAGPRVPIGMSCTWVRWLEPRWSRWGQLGTGLVIRCENKK